MTTEDKNLKSFDQKLFNIAIISPGNSSIVRETRMGFVSGLASQFNGDVSINVYGEYASTDQELKEIATDVMQENYDLLLAIGVQCARLVKEVAETRANNTKPTVFVGVRDPERYGLVRSDGSTWNYMTGVKSGGYDYRYQVELLYWLKPEMKRVLVVCDPLQLAGMTQEASEQVKQFLAKRSVRSDVLYVSSKDDIKQKLPEWLSVVDTVITLRDHTTMTYLREIANYCNHYKVTLCGSDPKAIEYGAAIGIGGSNYECGYVSALPARLILEGTSPQDIPLSETSGQNNIELNYDVMRLQNLNISPTVVFALKSFKLV